MPVETPTKKPPAEKPRVEPPPVRQPPPSMYKCEKCTNTSKHAEDLYYPIRIA